MSSVSLLLGHYELSVLSALTIHVQPQLGNHIGFYMYGILFVNFRQFDI